MCSMPVQELTTLGRGCAPVVTFPRCLNQTAVAHVEFSKDYDVCYDSTRLKMINFMTFRKSRCAEQLWYWPDATRDTSSPFLCKHWQARPFGHRSPVSFAHLAAFLSYAPPTSWPAVTCGATSRCLPGSAPPPQGP